MLLLVDVVKRICEIKKEWEALHTDLANRNELLAKARAKELVIEYVTNGSADTDFFEKIAEIHTKTQQEYTEDFQNTYKKWHSILETKEKQVIFMLKERLAKHHFSLGMSNGINGSEEIKWIVIGLDPYLNRVHLISKDCLDPVMFHENGYTEIEDADEFGCAELACGWATSDIRKYLNCDFYNRAFTEEEKELILKIKRHMNRDDFLIPNDCSEDYVYLLSLDEFLLLEPQIQQCSSIGKYNAWWLGEQKSRGWDDTGELPQIYVVNCKSGELTSRTGNTKLLTRVGITVNLEVLVTIQYPL